MTSLTLSYFQYLILSSSSVTKMCDACLSWIVLHLSVLVLVLPITNLHEGVSNDPPLLLWVLHRVEGGRDSLLKLAIRHTVGKDGLCRVELQRGVNNWRGRSSAWKRHLQFIHSPPSTTPMCTHIHILTQSRDGRISNTVEPLLKDSLN